jgi:rhomboid family GlyGly-CTERM serine protease
MASSRVIAHQNASIEMNSLPTTIGFNPRRPAVSPSPTGQGPLRLELIGFAVVIALLNLALLSGGVAGDLRFLPSAVREGEWWRVITHPFVHLSWYHLALDAAAFLLAYAELRRHQRIERIALVVAAGAGSLMVSWWGDPAVATQGLCGLSGIAHGLTAVLGIEMLRHERDRVSRLGGWLCFGAVVTKSAFEALTGQVVLASWHFGWLGTPIAVSHAGGVLGVLTMIVLLGLGRDHPGFQARADGSRPDQSGIFGVTMRKNRLAAAPGTGQVISRGTGSGFVMSVSRVHCPWSTVSRD